MLKQLDIDFNSVPTHLRSFSGSDYVPKFDEARLKGQLSDIYKLMKDGKYRTVEEIRIQTGNKYPENSIQANLRNLRKVQFGSHKVEKRHRGERKNGIWEYQLKMQMNIV